VEYGFRLPSALDNRPSPSRSSRPASPGRLRSAPASYERRGREQVANRSSAPRADRPAVECARPYQVDDSSRKSRTVARQERILVTTLTKRMAEDLTSYYAGLGIRVKFFIPTSKRSSGWRSSATCAWEFDVLVASTCCARLDLPEVSLVAILDADKEAFCGPRPR